MSLMHTTPASIGTCVICQCQPEWTHVALRFYNLWPEVPVVKGLLCNICYVVVYISSFNLYIVIW